MLVVKDKEWKELNFFRNSLLISWLWEVTNLFNEVVLNCFVSFWMIELLESYEKISLWDLMLKYVFWWLYDVNWDMWRLNNDLIEGVLIVKGEID
jgi:hypothetical protein